MNQAGWWRSLTRWFLPDSAQRVPSSTAATHSVAATGAAHSRPPPEPPQPPTADTAASRPLRPVFLLCLLGYAPHPASAWAVPAASAEPDPAALQMLDQLDHVIASDAQCSQLLRRAPDVVPQLMRTLRDDSYSSAEVARRISRDVVLSAEVIRLASNTLRRSDMATADLAQAVAVIGTQGLRRVIAHVVLRPLFAAHGNTLSARAAPHIWADADKKARLCAALAHGSSIDPLDAYLAGLLHNAGWSAALRAIDNASGAALPAASWAHPEVADALFVRRDRLFAKLVPPWQLGAALGALAHEIGHSGLDAAASPMAQVLRQAQELAALHTLQAQGVLGGGVAAPPALAAAVSETYLALSDL